MKNATGRKRLTNRNRKPPEEQRSPYPRDARVAQALGEEEPEDARDSCLSNHPSAAHSGRFFSAGDY